MSRNVFTDAVDENQILEERFRNLIHESFDGMYYAMGKLNFLRWIDKRRISDRIKILVVEEFSEEDYDTGGIGYYIRGANKIKLSGMYVNDEGVFIHEANHFLTDFSDKNKDKNLDDNKEKRFPIFLDEGLSDYLDREYERIIKRNNSYNEYSYRENVDFVEFLHKSMGDILIKTYYIGRTEKSDLDFSTYLTDDGKPSLYVLNDFFDSLNKVHKAIHPKGKTDTQEKIENKKKAIKKVEKTEYPKLRKIVENIIINTIRKKAQNLEYYKDGKIDFKQFLNDFNKEASLVCNTIVNSVFGLDSNTFENEFLDNIIKKSLEAVLQSSHVSPDKINELVSLYCNGNGVEIAELDKKVNNTNQFKTLEGLANNRLGNKEKYIIDGEFNIGIFIMDLSLIIDKMALSDELRKYFLDSVILRFLPKDYDKDSVMQAVDKHFRFYSSLQKKMQNGKRDVIESKFIWINDYEFVEKRDNSLYYINFNNETGKIEESRIIPTPEDIYHNPNPDLNIARFRSSYSSTHFYTIQYDDKFDNVILDNNSHSVYQGYEDLGESFFTCKTFFDPIYGNIKNDRYILKLDDGYETDPNPTIKGIRYTQIVPDHRSRIVNFKLFAQELEEIINQIPSRYRNSFVFLSFQNLFQKNYYCIPSNIDKIVDLKRLTKEPMDIDFQEELLKCMQELNQKRREYIDSKKNINGISFANEEARKRYKESENSKKRRKQHAKFVQDFNAFVNIEGRGAIIEPYESSEESLNDKYYSIDGVKYNKTIVYNKPTAQKVDYKKFLEDLKEKLNEIPPENKYRFIRNVLNSAIYLWYGYASGYNYNLAYEIDERRETLFEEIHKIAIDFLDDGKEIDFKELSEIEKSYLQISKEEYKICLIEFEKRKVIGFENDSAEMTYEIVTRIMNDRDLNPETKKKLVADLQEKNSKKVKKSKSMAAFAKLALSGKDIPTDRDIRSATVELDLYHAQEFSEFSDN